VCIQLNVSVPCMNELYLGFFSFSFRFFIVKVAGIGNGSDKVCQEGAEG